MMRPSFISTPILRMLWMSVSGSASRTQDVRAFSGFDRSRTRRGSARRDRAVLRRCDERLRRRHAELHETFDADDRADAVILVFRFGRA